MKKKHEKRLIIIDYYSFCRLLKVKKYLKN